MYDPFGRRIYKSVSTGGTSVFAYDDRNLVEETNSTGTVVARYSSTDKTDEPLAMLRSSVTSYYNADGLGSVTSLTSSSGAAAQTYTYDSFGKVTASSGSLTNPFQYTGREMDAETGLYYYRARYYDSAAGRFLAEDPSKFWGGINLYQYALNSPQDYIDPSGLDPTKKWYDWGGWNWVPGVQVTKCSIWSHYCWKNVQQNLTELNKHPFDYTDDELRHPQDEGKRRIQICTLGDDNCKRLVDQCGGLILGLIYNTGAFPKPGGPYYDRDYPNNPNP